MIQKITSNSTKQIQNKDFLQYTQIYTSREQATLSHIETLGVPLASFQQKKDNEKVIDDLAEAGALVRNNKNSVVSNDKISPACVACRTGSGSFTTYTSLKCHRNCYFCFNPNQEDYVIYKDSQKDIIKELENLLELNVKLDHLALTGGEPLLFKKEMIDFFAYANEKTPETYTRLYTTGDLFDDETLKSLQQVNLNEVRFSIKMDDSKNKIRHTLKQIELAKQYIPNILVEMPVIPGTMEEMKQLLLELDRLNIFGINLLEFCFPLGNAEEFAKRGFSLKNPPYEVYYNYWYAGGLAVAESEEMCLELVQFAIDNNLNLGVHYCSLENKHTGQIYQQNINRTVDDTYTFSNRDFFYKTAKAFGKNRRVVKRMLDERNIPYSENEDFNFIQFPLESIELFRFRNIEICISDNVIEEDEKGTSVREVGINWTTPAFFDIKTDI